MTAESRTPVLTGGCQCGALRYALYAAPHNVHLCHCRMCQKAVGGPFAALAPVRRTDFAWTRGEPGTFASSTVARRDFCPRCGTPLTFRFADSETLSVTLGSLDTPRKAVPIFHSGIESRVSWLDRLASLPTNLTTAMVPAERQARTRSFQHPDHDTPADWKPPAP